MIRCLAVLLSTCALAAQSQFRPARGTPLPPSGSIAPGDVDGDGDVDLVVVGSANLLLLNDGRGRLTDATSGRLTTPPAATRAVALADVDGDGDLDLLLCSFGDRHGLYLNNGAGVFTEVSATAVPPRRSLGIDQLVVDLDGDGDVDWLIASTGGHGSPAPVLLYLNNGAGVFTDASPGGLLGGAFPGPSFAVDLDGDGDVDIVMSGPNAPVLLNAGGARFAPAPTGYLPARGGTGTHHWAGDVTGDGLPDLFLENNRILLRNLGGGRFQDESWVLPPSVPNTAGIGLDADLDGDLDVVGENLLWLNDGTGRFTAANARGPVDPGTFPRAPMVAADLDGDGDADLMSSGATPVRYLNYLWQVDAPSPARTGQGYAVDMYVRPGFAQNAAALVPSLAFGSVVTPLPPLGTLRLDPASIFVLGVYLTSPPTGRAQIAHVIPLDPSLVGLELHHQTLVVESLATATLSNAIFDVIQ